MGALRRKLRVPNLFLELPSGSVGNGIRFDMAGRMFVADFRKHNIFMVEPGGRAPLLYVHDNRFNQPNDLAVAVDGTLFASIPTFEGNRPGLADRSERRSIRSGYADACRSSHGDHKRDRP